MIYAKNKAQYIVISQKDILKKEELHQNFPKEN